MAEALPVGLNYGPDYPKLVDPASVSRYGKRVLSIVQTSDPFWQVEMRVVGLAAAERQRLDAFISRCRNGQTTVHYKPQHILLPRAYWGNPDAPEISDAGVVAAIAGSLVTVSGVTNGLKLMEGDLVGFSQGNFNTISRVIADVTASDGGVILSVYPFLPSYITQGATVVFKSPVMNMRLVPDSYNCPDEFRPTATFTLTEAPE